MGYKQVIQYSLIPITAFVVLVCIGISCSAVCSRLKPISSAKPSPSASDDVMNKCCKVDKLANLMEEGTCHSSGDDATTTSAERDRTILADQENEDDCNCDHRSSTAITRELEAGV